MKLCILGRQADISIAELEAVYGASAIEATTQQAALITTEHLAFARLGGTQKIAEVFHVSDSLANQGEMRRLLSKYATPQTLFTDPAPAGKRRLGISLYGLREQPKDITGIALELKKILKKNGVSIGVVPNKTAELSSAQVLHNHLYDPQKGAEIIVALIDGRYIFAVTRGVQDIDAYSARDQARPARDARVGMLPPKLAQIILNLAVGAMEERRRKKEEGRKPRVILDPFCGTGVVLQEALLSGYRAYGSDISPAMVRASEENLAWLQAEFGATEPYRVELGDATVSTWEQPITAIASEIYLGEPLTTQPSPQQVEQFTQTSHQLIISFLSNLAPQIATGTRLCLAVPAWRTQLGFSASLSVDDLKQLGYTAMSFEHSSKELVYIRDNQFTGRRLLVLTKS